MSRFSWLLLHLSKRHVWVYQEIKKVSEVIILKTYSADFLE